VPLLPLRIRCPDSLASRRALLGRDADGWGSRRADGPKTKKALATARGTGAKKARRTEGRRRGDARGTEAATRGALSLLLAAVVILVCPSLVFLGPLAKKGKKWRGNVLAKSLGGRRRESVAGLRQVSPAAATLIESWLALHCHQESPVELLSASKCGTQIARRSTGAENVF
jgi:hypothetical protein